jgi:beta-1,4-mannosyltransferase
MIDAHRKLTVGSFPYAPGFNPYQRLFTEALESAGLNVIRIPPEKWFPIQKAFAVNCDLLHFDWPHDWYAGRNFATKTLKRWMYLSGLRKKSSAKLVWTVHNLVAHDCPDPRYEIRMIQALVDRCDGLMVMSEVARQKVRAQYQVHDTPIQVVKHGHYIDCYPNVVSREAARNALGIPPDEQVFLALGSIRRYKGHLELVKRFCESATGNQRLIIAGVARNKAFAAELRSLADELAQAASCKIDLHLQMIADDRLQYFFNASDICILPFQKVLNSGSLLLAMSFGLPVVAPAIGSIPEIAHPNWSVLYDPSDEQALGRALAESALKNPINQRQQIRSEVLEFARAHYAWETVGQNLRDWYLQLLNEPANR